MARENQYAFRYQQFGNAGLSHIFPEMNGRNNINGDGDPSTVSSRIDHDIRHRIFNPDRLINARNSPHGPRGDNFQRSQIHLPRKPPSWMLKIIMTILGIGTSKFRIFIGKFLYTLTVVTALLFGVSGLTFNIYDVSSQLSETSVIVMVTKSILGAFWMSLGVYANKLAFRLFNNPRVIECIRMHSKTFLKMNTVVLVSFLCMATVGTNLYSNSYLLGDDSHAGLYDNKNKTLYANCASLGVKMILCDIYFTSRVIYCSICLIWNLIVVAIYLSICRTHTVGIRRFMKELISDSRIYEEYCLLQQARDRRSSTTDNNFDLDESWAIWDDDIFLDVDTAGTEESSSEVLRNLRCFRKQVTSQPPFSEQDNTYMHDAARTRSQELDGDFQTQVNSEERKEDDQEHNWLNNRGPPILSNEDLMFTYFTLLRRLSSSSRLLQRWISSWITFTLLWCILYVVFWINHSPKLHGIVQFLLPLLALTLITSAYAEVNFEGDRLLKCVLPTVERIPVIYYFNQTPLELKIFSFTMTYNGISTVVAGIAITFSTRILLDQVT